MHVGPPIIDAAAKERINHHRTAVTSVHSHITSDTSCQGRQQRNPQPNFDSVNQTVGLVHADLPFAEGLNICGSPGNTTKPEFIAKRTIFSARRAPQTMPAAVLKSLSDNLLFCLIFIRHKISLEIFPQLWGVLPIWKFRMDRLLRRSSSDRRWIGSPSVAPSGFPLY
jgi:hypothetical protein